MKLRVVAFKAVFFIALLFSSYVYADQSVVGPAVVTSESHAIPKLVFTMFLLPAFCISCLPGRQKRFHFYYRFFTWIVLCMILLTPLFTVLLYNPHPLLSDLSLIKSVVWLTGIILLLIYTSWRCTSEQLSYLDGLMFIAAAGTSGMIPAAGAVVGFPMLIFVIIVSFLFSAFNDLTRKTKITPEQFQKLIGRIYKSQMKGSKGSE